MKFIIYYCILIIVVIIILPLIIIKGCGGVKKDLLEDSMGKKIKVYFHKTKEIKEIALEDYIRGVVAAEMPASYNIEALKAQAVAARTYAYRKLKTKGAADLVHPGADVCTDSAHCQAWVSRDEALKNWSASNRGVYWDKISWAVKSTAGEIILYKGEIANPVFHANSSGKTEDTEEVWAGEPIPYLRSVDSPGEENSSSYQSQAEFTADQLTQRITKEFQDFKLTDEDLGKSIKIKDYTRSGRVKNIIIGNKTFKGTVLRKLLELKSTNFSVEIPPGKVVFKVKGFGHGVGMSQCGANCLAQKGKTYKEILEYYYRGVEVK